MKPIPYKSFTLKGEKYRAVAYEGCDGCAFENDYVNCQNHPSHCGDHRPDGKSVIWVKVEKKV